MCISGLNRCLYCSLAILLSNYCLMYVIVQCYSVYGVSVVHVCGWAGIGMPYLAYQYLCMYMCTRSSSLDILYNPSMYAWALCNS